MYKCSSCSTLFYSMVDCEAHLANEHPDQGDSCVQVQFRCPVCGQVFGHKTDVTNHALRDHGKQRVAPLEIPA